MNARRIVALFLAFGATWIWTSDRAIDLFVPDAHVGNWLQSIKGLLFVVLSAVLIYVLVRRAEEARAEGRRREDERQRLVAGVFEASQEGIGITDAEGRYISVNQAFTRITGYKPEEIVGQTPAVLKSGRQDAAFYEEMWRQLRAEGRWEGEIWNRRKTGEIFPEWLTISAIHDAEGRVCQYLGIFTETTSRKAAEERIERLVNHDQLTGLPNRALLQDRAKVALASASRTHVPVAVMQLNIDHFRDINETMGPEAGDQVLITVAQRLQNVLRPEDTVSRLGADEFIVLLPHTPVQDVPQIALRLMLSVNDPLTVAGQELLLTASIGIAEFPENGADLPRLVQSAAAAMSQAVIVHEAASAVTPRSDCMRGMTGMTRFWRSAKDATLRASARNARVEDERTRGPSRRMRSDECRARIGGWLRSEDASALTIPEDTSA